jgi:hypothetical protein
MATNNHRLLGRRVVLLWSAQTRSYANGVNMKGQIHKGEIFLRGIVQEVDRLGVFVVGRQTIKKTDTQSVREFPIDDREKPYFIPWTSVAGIEIIEKGSDEEKIDNIICQRDKASGH